MQSKQLELFKTFTLAEERNDIHTSAAAMLRDYMEQMDFDNIRLMLSEAETLADLDKDTFYARLQRAFLHMHMSGNTVLESAEGRCNRCHPNATAFLFRGTNIPWHVSFLFHIKDNKVVNVDECMLLWKQFPEVDGGLKLYLDERIGMIAKTDGFMEDPPF
ncbi:MAG: hypothetical protein ACKO7B_16565 [Flavobacteriales bacterium]